MNHLFVIWYETASRWEIRKWMACFFSVFSLVLLNAFFLTFQCVYSLFFLSMVFAISRKVFQVGWWESCGSVHLGYCSDMWFCSSFQSVLYLTFISYFILLLLCRAPLFIILHSRALTIRPSSCFCFCFYAGVSVCVLCLRAHLYSYPMDRLVGCT